MPCWPISHILEREALAFRFIEPGSTSWFGPRQVQYGCCVQQLGRCNTQQRELHSPVTRGLQQHQHQCWSICCGWLPDRSKHRDRQDCCKCTDGCDVPCRHVGSWAVWKCLEWCHRPPWNLLSPWYVGQSAYERGKVDSEPGLPHDVGNDPPLMRIKSQDPSLMRILMDLGSSWIWDFH